MLPVLFLVMIYLIEEYIKKEHDGITLGCCVKATLSP
jgi:hypothetical protein